MARRKIGIQKLTVLGVMAIISGIATTSLIATISITTTTGKTNYDKQNKLQQAKQWQ